MVFLAKIALPKTESKISLPKTESKSKIFIKLVGDLIGRWLHYCRTVERVEYKLFVPTKNLNNLRIGRVVQTLGDCCKQKNSLVIMQ